MLASVDKRFVLLSNPKTGTTALEAAFEKFADIRIGGSPKWKHISFEKMTEIFGDYFQRRRLHHLRGGPASGSTRWPSWYRYRSRPDLARPGTSGTTSTPATSASRSSSREGRRLAAAGAAAGSR